jgi:hypothetical protein
MKTNRIKITENELKHIVNESVKKVLKESTYGNDNYEVFNNIKDRLLSAHQQYHNAIIALQKWYKANKDHATDSGESYADKCTNEALYLHRESLTRLNGMLH